MHTLSSKILRPEQSQGGQVGVASSWMNSQVGVIKVFRGERWESQVLNDVVQTSLV